MGEIAHGITIKSPFGLIRSISTERFPGTYHTGSTGALVFEFDVYLKDYTEYFGSTQFCPHCKKPLGMLEQLNEFNIVIDKEGVITNINKVYLQLSMLTIDERGEKIQAGDTVKFSANAIVGDK